VFLFFLKSAVLWYLIPENIRDFLGKFYYEKIPRKKVSVSTINFIQKTITIFSFLNEATETMNNLIAEFTWKQTDEDKKLAEIREREWAKLEETLDWSVGKAVVVVPSLHFEIILTITDPTVDQEAEVSKTRAKIEPLKLTIPWIVTVRTEELQLFGKPSTISQEYDMVD